MRVAIGGIEHETNTYATSSMGPTTLQRFATLRGDEFARTAGTRTTLGGFADAAERVGCELVPTLWAMAGPSGTIERATYDALRSELLDRLSDAGPVDAVVLSLHGAGVVDSVDDLESDLVVGVRTVVGEIPIVTTLDLRPELVAVERNRDLVPRDRRAETRLEEGDQLEVVTLVGGG